MNDFLGQALGNSRFPDTGLPDQYRIVLGPTAQDPHYVLQFLFPAQHRIQFVLTGQFIQIAPKTFQQFQRFLRLCFRLFLLRLRFEFILLRQGMGLDKLFMHHNLHAVHADIKTSQNPGGNTAFFCQKPQQDMSGAYQIKTVRIRKRFSVMHGRRRFL